MRPIERIECIINHYTYQDITNIILGYVFNECVVCKGYTRDFLCLYDDSFICSKCVIEREVIECQQCKMIYVFDLGADCIICNEGICRLFCNFCKKD